MIDDAYEAVRALLKPARLDMEAKRRAFVAPYSSHDALIAYYEAWGVQRGIARALEALEARP